MGVESDLPVVAAGLAPNLERKCGELLFRKSCDSISPVLIPTLEEDEAGFSPVDKSIDRNDSDWCVNDAERVIRLMDERTHVPNDVPEM